MLVRLKVSDRLEVEVPCEDLKELFAHVGPLQEVLDRMGSCGMSGCGSNDIRFSYRTPQGYEYYELRCGSCGATFKFGQRQDGSGLFPKLKDQNGQDLPNGGWSVYQRPGQQQPVETVEAKHPELAESDIPF